jgi:NAD(P)-dependent dehydrogenase (short-subunit alcohol dehydrogenase family)
MEVKNKVVVVTGGANGIGEALCRRFAAEGAKVVVSDIDEKRTQTVAGEIGGLAIKTDVTKETEVINLVKKTEEIYGPIDLLCSNAGIAVWDGQAFSAVEAKNEDWQRSWEINVMGHVYASRAVLPSMTARKEGYILITASAAGLLSQIGSAPYSVTKHAAIGYAETLAISHGGDGIKVSVLCPQAVNTDLLEGRTSGAESVDGIMEPDELAGHTIEGLADEKFLILPHKAVTTYVERKTADYDRWLSGMRRLRLATMDTLKMPKK